jgi:hypothetical protein
MKSCSEHGDNSNVCEDAGCFPTNVIQHPSGQSDQDWHRLAAIVADKLQNSYYNRKRLLRCHSMAMHAVRANNWSAYDNWMIEAARLKAELAR